MKSARRKVARGIRDEETEPQRGGMLGPRCPIHLHAERDPDLGCHLGSHISSMGALWTGTS